MVSTERVLVVDIGGTKTALGVSVNGALSGVCTFQTGSPCIAAQLVQMVKERSAGLAPCARIGVACGGALSTDRRTIVSAHHLGGWRDVRLVELFEGQFGLPTTLENDANCGAIAEGLLGAGMGRDSVLYITVSTGVGGGLWTSGGLVRGSTGNAIEVGHMTINTRGPQCGCGSTGCLEVYASGPAISRRAESVCGRQIGAREVWALAATGEAWAVELWNETAFMLGAGLANAVSAYDPAVVVLAGGVVDESPKFVEHAAAIARGRVLAPMRGVDVVLGMLGPFAPLAGAGLAAIGAH